jgi:hypothetical protein
MGIRKRVEDAELLWREGQAGEILRAMLRIYKSALAFGRDE